MLGIIGAMDQEVAEIKERMEQVTVSLKVFQSAVKSHLTGQVQFWRAMVRRVKIMKKCFRMVKIQKGSWKGVQGSISYAGIPMFREAFPMKERFC